MSVSVFYCSAQTVNAKESQKVDLSSVVYNGGDGKTLANAIVITNAGNESNGIAAEYAFIGAIYGDKFVNWKPAGQSTITQNDKKFDLVTIELIQKKQTVSYYFDITDFYAKFEWVVGFKAGQ